MATRFACSIIQPVEERLQRAAIAVLTIASPIWAGSGRDLSRTVNQ
jgi:hypothetical protein